MSYISKIYSNSWTAFSLRMPTILLGISIALNLILIFEVIHFKQKAMGTATEPKLEIGALVPPVNAKRLRGEPLSISYEGDGLPTILYIFSPHCVWCSHNLENVKALAKATEGKYRFIALSLIDDGVQDYVTKNAINFTVGEGISSETRVDYLLGKTPQTIVVSADGRVQKNWIGAYDASTAKQVEEYFNVTLPGLSAAGKEVTQPPMTK